MKKIGILFLALGTQIIFAQATRFVYQVSMMPDSTDLKSVKSEIAHLDIGSGKSIFYGENRVKRDSIINRMRQTKDFDRSKIESVRSILNYTIEKNLTNQTLVYNDRVGRDQYSYPETPVFNWKILPETAKIGDYKTQKAETNYGGRIWYAWFTTEIPIQDGPYKFSGLPGLIVKAQDKEGEYSFDLMQTKKIPEIQTLQTRGQIVSITKEKFKGLQKKFQTDPLTYINQNRSSGGGNFGGSGGNRDGGGNRGRFGSGGGNNSDQQEMQKKMVSEIRNNNNPLELK